MADVYFKCKHCQRSLAVDEAAVGRTVKCSDCKKPITVPKPEIDWDCSCGASMMVPSNMAGETIQCVVCNASYKVPEVKQGKLPAAGTNMPVSGFPQPGKSRTLAGKRQDQQVTPGVSQLQNNPNMVAQSTKCPFCGNMLPGDAVSCVKCGVDFKTGKIAKKTANASDDKLVAPESTADKKAACPSCSGDNPVSATQCQHCGKSLDSRKTGDSKTGDAEGMLELWDSITIAKWSLLFSPVFGGTLLYHNWKALGDDARAAKALKWVYVGLGLLAISVFVKWAALLYLPYLAVWYLMECRPQQLLIKSNPEYVRKPWEVPVGLAAAVFVVYVGVVAMSWIPTKTGSENESDSIMTSQHSDAYKDGYIKGKGKAKYHRKIALPYDDHTEDSWIPYKKGTKEYDDHIRGYEAGYHDGFE